MSLFRPNLVEMDAYLYRRLYRIVLEHRKRPYLHDDTMIKRTRYGMKFERQSDGARMNARKSEKATLTLYSYLSFI